MSEAISPPDPLLDGPVNAADMPSEKPVKSKPKPKAAVSKKPAAAAPKKAAPKKEAKSDEKAKLAEGFVADSENPLHKGSTRMRLFKALKKYPDGLTVALVKMRCGMTPRSGNLGWVVAEEVKKGRVKKITVNVPVKGSNHDEKEVTAYILTKAGYKALADGTVDANKNAGNRIGKAWTKARVKAERELKASA